MLLPTNKKPRGASAALNNRISSKDNRCSRPTFPISERAYRKNIPAVPAQLETFRCNVPSLSANSLCGIRFSDPVRAFFPQIGICSYHDRAPAVSTAGACFYFFLIGILLINFAMTESPSSRCSSSLRNSCRAPSMRCMDTSFTPAP